MVFALALVVMVVESVVLGVFSVQVWALQTPVMVAVYLGLERDFVSGGAILVLLLFPVEWLVGGVYGLYSAGLGAAFLLMGAMGAKLQPVWGVARAVAAGAAGLVHGGTMLVLLLITGQGGTPLSTSVGWQLLGGVVTVAVGTVLLGKAFASLDDMMDPRNRGAELAL